MCRVYTECHIECVLRVRSESARVTRCTDNPVCSISASAQEIRYDTRYCIWRAGGGGGGVRGRLSEGGEGGEAGAGGGGGGGGGGRVSWRLSECGEERAARACAVWVCPSTLMKATLSRVAQHNTGPRTPHLYTVPHTVAFPHPLYCVTTVAHSYHQSLSLTVRNVLASLRAHS